MRGKHGPAEEPRGGEEGALRVEVNMVGGISQREVSWREVSQTEGRARAS